MKTWNFILFLSIVLAVHTLVNYYIFIRGWQALPNIKSMKIIYLIGFIFLFLSYILARLLDKSDFRQLTAILTWIGSFWMSGMLYFFLFILFFDILRAVNFFIGFFPAFITNEWQMTKQFSATLTTLSVFIIVLFGYINARNPVVKSLEVSLDKPFPSGNPEAREKTFQSRSLGTSSKRLSIAVISDIHIGTIVNRAVVKELTERIMAQQPDVILFPGDILDEDVTPVIRDKMGEPLKELKAKYGVYACTGNHEYIGGVEPSVQYIESLGIKVLRDEAVNIAGKFWLLGREDRDIITFAGKHRKKLQEIMKDVDKNMPVIMMDHQPFNLNEAVENGVDLQLSGHTHHGQLFPFNFITKMVYELSWGYKKKGNTHIYVSSGYGTWGPPVRLGNKPEMILIVMRY